MNAVRWIAGKITPLKNCAFEGFGKMIDALDNLGYTNGVNYQTVPYDFRFSVKKSGASNIILKAIEELYKNTGKKVILVGHSLGNLHILKTLSNMFLGAKREKVLEFISIGAPYLGSSKAVKDVIAW